MGRDARNNIHSFERPRLPVSLQDLFGRELRVGDKVMLPGQTGLTLWEIVELSPDLTPLAPNNQVRCVIRSAQQFQLPTSLKTHMILVMPAPEAKDEPPSSLVEP